MSTFCEITDQYLDKLYDDCLREEARLLNSLRNITDYEAIDDRCIQRQAQMLHAIAHTSLKFKMYRKKMASRSL